MFISSGNKIWATMNRPKILFILPSLKAGGTEKVLSFIVNSLKSDFFQVKLIVTGFKEESFFEINKSVTYLNKSRFTNSIVDLHKKMKSLNPDIIFSSSHQINTFLLIYNFFFNIKLILRINSMPSFIEGKSLQKKIKSFLYKKTFKIIFQSKAIETDFIETFGFSPSNSIIINNPVSITNKKLKQCKIPHYITIASLTELKGHKRILECLSKLEFVFLYSIIGDGILFEKLKEYVKELNLENKVVFEGENKEPDKFLHENSIYLLGSYFEGFPNSILEVLSHGIPVISFNSPGGHNEILIQDFNGYICNGENQFIEKLKISLEKKWDKPSIIADIKNRFNSQKIISEYSNLLSSK